MLSALIGLVVCGVSVWGMIVFRSELLVVLRGLLPLCFFFGGLIAVVAGVSALGLKSSRPLPEEAKEEKAS